MIKVKKLVGTEYVEISLQDALLEYHQTPPKNWFEDIEIIINKGLEINDNESCKAFLKKTNLGWFDYKSVNTLYQNFKKSKYNDMFDDDILRFISYIYGLGYFERTNFEMDVNKPNLEKWLNTKNVFSSYNERSLMKEDENIHSWICYLLNMV